MLRSTLIRTAIAGVAVLGLAGCGGGGDQLGSDNAGSSPAPSKVSSITVGSADFSESQLLAEIYGQAIAAKGIEVKKKPNMLAKRSGQVLKPVSMLSACTTSFLKV